ncbi:hypothetical protein EXIGLDRAFT_831882 [Exidia glandulosa HHB12029]|uniref:Ubiquitin-like domain-containing protein n=1 Tax=Exidia glandulosa HHB12029 TaxID=1314781 RepID=A0A165M7W4_EXIGL|nr:hypothetical protein EXIGLDRAFT_831882 [Exidia glandulosa HHB12029]
MADTPEKKPKIPTATPEQKQEKFQITLKHQSGQTVKFLVKPSTVFQKIFASFHEQTHTQAGTLKFIYNGQRVRPEDTPAQFEMEEDDEPEIEAHAEQVGGCGV